MNLTIRVRWTRNEPLFADESTAPAGGETGDKEP